MIARYAATAVAALTVLPAFAATGCSDDTGGTAAPSGTERQTTAQAAGSPSDTSSRAASTAYDRVPLARSRSGARVSTIATGLEVPWDLAFLPDGRALVTERPGRVRLLTRDRRLRRTPLARIDVSAQGEGGLLGVAVDPRFGRGSDFVHFYSRRPPG